ncbi:MAG TPA: ABC transporter permease [Bryobacteraceae bacterium]|nr:ABC transporter permease [Bryobacteraceae bacterium]
MRRLRGELLRLSGLFGKARRDRELSEEIASHLQMHIDDNLRSGMTEEEARRDARMKLGGVDTVKEQYRDRRGIPLIETTWQDLRYALRMLRKAPGFTAVAILSLALGIGANTAIFSLVNAVMLRTLPVNRPDRLVLLTPVDRGNFEGNFAYPDYQRLRDRNQSFSGVIASGSLDRADIALGGATERMDGELVSGNYFSVLGVQAAAGRLLGDQDDRTGAPAAAVISHGFWKRSFAADPSALGKIVDVNGVPVTIVGVAPKDFLGESAGKAPAIWLPLSLQPLVEGAAGDLRGVRYITWLDVMGRLRDGVSLAQAQANVTVLQSQIQAEFKVDPQHDYLHHIALAPGSHGSTELRQKFSRPALTLLSIVAVVLLMACTNLASLLLARAASRQREIGTRLAIGASRSRLIRQLLTESLVLSLLGGVLGLAIAFQGTRVLLDIVNSGRGLVVLNLQPDTRILLFTLAVSIGAGLLFGLVPALQAVRRNAVGLGSRNVASAERRWGWRDALIAAQVALALLLLASGGLFLRTLRNLKTLDPGFRAENVLLVELDSSRDGYEGARLVSLATQVLERTAAIPSVRSASVSFFGNLSDAGGQGCCFATEGFTPRNRQDQQAALNYVAPDYFRTLGIPVLAGREFSLGDTANSPKVAIINETMARHFFGARPAIGRRLEWVKKQYQVVGVVKDSKYRELREKTPRMIYFSLLQDPHDLHMLQVRTAASPLAIARTIQEMLHAIDPRLHIGDIGTLSKRIDAKLSREYLLADISSFIGALTLLLVSIGIYGTLAYSVARRTSEIGIRMALGAQPSSVKRMILRDILLVVAIGLAAGIGATLVSLRWIASLLFGVTPTDPLTIVAAALLLSMVALGAGYLPARRASRVDPLTALRFE